MKKNLFTAIYFTLVTTVICGGIYPLAVTAMAQLLFHDRANGQLITKDGKIVGSRIIGQSFSGAGYFHSRPSAAGAGYDSTASGGSNLAPTNRPLVERVKANVQQLQQENPHAMVPIDLVTTSASGLDPEISPASAEFQVSRIARARYIQEEQLRTLVQRHTKNRDLGFLGEPRVNVLELNLDLDNFHPGS
jgi:K+-transporting ATPase ATPase C chain